MNSFFGITRESIEKRSSEFHEPRWLREERKGAFERLLHFPEPDWKKKKIPKVDISQSIRLPFAQKSFSKQKYQKKNQQELSGKITLQDGNVSSVSVRPELLTTGVIFCDLRTALLERSDLLEKYFKRKGAEESVFTLLMDAFFDNGYFLFIPKNILLEEPFQVEIIQQNSKKSLLHKGIMIIDEGGSAMLEEIIHSEHSSEEMNISGLSRLVFTHRHSKFQMFSIQDFGKKVYDCSSQYLFAEEDSYIKFFQALLGSRSGNVIIESNPIGEKSRIEQDGILIAADQQQFSITARLHHTRPSTEGIMKYKAILKGESYCFFNGLIRVEKEAEKTISRLEDHTILLSEKARSDALPALDIRTNDVKISHAASVSKADQEKIFYLMTRGLSEEEAKKLLTEGFLESLLSSLPHQSFYETTKDFIEAKLAA